MSGRVKTVVMSFTLALASLASLGTYRAGAQSSSNCGTDRVLSTLVGAGLGAAVAGIPATIVHRHDQNTSHRIVIGSVSAGAIIGFMAAGRDRPCASAADALRAGDTVLVRRSTHALRGGITGFVIGGALGVAGSTLYNVGEGTSRTGITLFTAAEGAAAGAILGSLIGWAWPAK